MKFSDFLKKQAANKAPKMGVPSTLQTQSPVPTPVTPAPSPVDVDANVLRQVKAWIDSHTINLSREGDALPQIANERLKRYFFCLKSSDPSGQLRISDVNIPIEQIVSAQKASDYNYQKILGFAAEDSDKPVLACMTHDHRYQLMDGHHQWAGMLFRKFKTGSNNLTVRGKVINTDLETLMHHPLFKPCMDANAHNR